MTLFSRHRKMMACDAKVGHWAKKKKQKSSTYLSSSLSAPLKSAVLFFKLDNRNLLPSTSGQAVFKVESVYFTIMLVPIRFS